jgi:hypothetical protein
LLAAQREHFNIGAGAVNAARAEVVDVTYRGSTRDVACGGSGSEPLSAYVRSRDSLPEKSETVSLTWAPRCFLLKPADATGAASGVSS